MTRTATTAPDITDAHQDVIRAALPAARFAEIKAAAMEAGADVLAAFAAQLTAAEKTRIREALDGAPVDHDAIAAAIGADRYRAIWSEALMPSTPDAQREAVIRAALRRDLTPAELATLPTNQGAPMKPEEISGTTSTYRVPVSIDGAPRVTADLVIVENTHWLPNPFPIIPAGWEHIDAAGHWHGFTGDAGILPTLDSDGHATRCRGCKRPDCPGVHLPRYTCRLCGDVVRVPLSRPGSEPLFSAIPMLPSWSALVDHGRLRGARVQARFFFPDGDFRIGVATTGSGRLNGDGPLHTRGAAGVRTTAFHQMRAA
jgi:hypothetical protein